MFLHVNVLVRSVEKLSCDHLHVGLSVSWRVYYIFFFFFFYKKTWNQTSGFDEWNIQAENLYWHTLCSLLRTKWYQWKWKSSTIRELIQNEEWWSWYSTDLSAVPKAETSALYTAPLKMGGVELRVMDAHTVHLISYGVHGVNFIW